MSETSPTTESRSAQLQIPLTPAELDELRQAAQHVGLAAASWARMILLAEARAMESGKV